LLLILSILPGIPVVGLPGMKIQLEASIASIFGILLGPYLGALSALLGTLIATFYGGLSLFNMIFILNPASNAFISGLLVRGRWREALVMFALIVIGFWLTPMPHPLHENWYVGVAATFDKVIALLLIPPLHKFMSGELSAITKRRARLLRLVSPIFLIAFIGNQFDSALGCLIFALPLVYQGIFGLETEFVRTLFIISPLAYPAIRLLQAVIASIIGIPLIKALHMSKLVPSFEHE